MNPARFTVSRPVFTTMVTLIAVLVGAVSLSRLPIDLMPEVTYPTLTISATYENASPEEVEELITRPIEQAVAAVAGVERINSTSSEGVSNVRVSFSWGTDIDVGANDLRDRLDRIVHLLPSEVARPQVRKFDLAATPVLILGAASPLDPLELRRLIDEQMSHRVERVPGVAALEVWGGLEREIRVELLPEKLQALDLTLEGIRQAIRDANLTVPAGEIERGRLEVTLRTPGQFTSLEELAATVLAVRDGAPVTLAQVAEIRDTHRKISRIVRINDLPGVRLAVRKQPDANTVRVAREVLREVERLNRDFPQVEIVPIIDFSEYIQRSIDNVGRSLMYGGALATLVLLFFLRSIRSTVVVAVAIPVSVIVTFALVYFGGFTLNLMTLGGLALGVGMMVDSAIVVLENIARLRSQGAAGADHSAEPVTNGQGGPQPAEPAGRALSARVTVHHGHQTADLTGRKRSAVPQIRASSQAPRTPGTQAWLIDRRCGAAERLRAREAAVQGTGEVTAAIVAGTLTTLVIFLPMLFAEQLAGVLFRQLALVVGFSLLAALVVALTLTPMLAARLVRPPATAREGARGPVAWLLRVSAAIFNGLERFYQRSLDGAMAQRGLVIIAFFSLFLVALMLLPLVGSEFLPQADEGQIRVGVEMETGTRLEVLDRKTREVEAIVLPAVPETRASVVQVGGTSFRTGAPANADIRLALVPQRERSRSSEEIVAALRPLLREIPGAQTRPRSGGLFVFRLIAGAEDERLVVEVRGFELELLDQMARQVRDAIADVEGISDLRLSREGGVPLELLRIDRQRAADLGLSVAAIARTIETAMAGSTAGQYRDGGQEYRIFLRLQDAELLDFDDILNITVRNDQGRFIPLRNVVRVERATGPLSIERQDQQRISRVQGEISGRDLGSVVAEVRQRLAEIPVPRGIDITFGGDYEEQEKAFGEMALALLLAVALVYMVMACLYESLRDPLIVMFSVPMALIGVVVMLLATGTTLNANTYIGAIMLVGIVVNNAILIVDQATRLRRDQGWSALAAAREAGRRRLRPILMTSLTTTFAMLPLALGLGEGSEQQAPMARAVIGGLLSSAFITLLLIPVLYSLFHAGRPGRSRSAAVAAMLPLVLLAVAVPGPPGSAAAANPPAAAIGQEIGVRHQFIVDEIRVQEKSGNNKLVSDPNFRDPNFRQVAANGPAERRSALTADEAARLERLIPRPRAGWALPQPDARGRLALSVEEAVLLALQNNRALGVQLYRPLIAGTFAAQERAVFDPALFAEATASREKSRSGSGYATREGENYRLGLEQEFAGGSAYELGVEQRRSTGAGAAGPEQRAGVFLTLTQALLRGGDRAANLAGVRRAELDSLASLHELHGFTQALVAEVENAYWNLVLSESRIAIVEEALAVAQAQLADVQRRIEVGTVAEIEQAAAEAELALRRQSLIDGVSARDRARIELLRLLNPSPDQRRAGGPAGTGLPGLAESGAAEPELLDPWALQPIPGDRPEQIELLPDPVAEHLALALRLRPDLEEARLRLEQGELEVVRTRNGLLPRLDLFLTLGKTGYADSFGSSWSDIGQGSGYGASAGLRLQQALGGQRGASARESRARFSRAQLQASLDNLAQLAAADVHKAHLEALRAHAQITASAERRRLQEKVLRVEEIKFEVGRGTTLNVAQAQRDLLESQLAEVDAKISYRRSLIDLYRLDGSLLQRRGIEITP